jgi:hypothetical protein
MSTESQGRRLAPAPNFRARITTRTARIMEACVRRRRRVAFCEMYHDAPRKPDVVYEQQRTEPRVPLPDEREHRLIEDGIRQGLITRARLICYRATQLLDNLGGFPRPTPPTERMLAHTFREIGEATQWALVAEATPSAENRERAARELREASAMCELHACTVETGEEARV